MNKIDHVRFHANTGKEYWENISEEESIRVRTKIGSTLKERWNNLSDEERLVGLSNIRTAQEKAVYNRLHNPITKAKYTETMSLVRNQYLADHPEMMNTLRRNAEHRIKFRNQPIHFNQEILGKVVTTVKGTKNQKKAIQLCDNNTELLNLFKEANPFVSENHQHTLSKIDFSTWGMSKMKRLLKWAGYKNWKTFVSNINEYNHKIVSIEYLSEKMDTGCITVDGNNEYHGNHTFAIDAGIFIKNSMNEDYFFPVTAEGRGSTVDILPGGQNLGEIDDLKYFNNRLARGLRVPSSYLPTGPDDNTTPLNDGRVGSAMIQEFRFNQYCERLQNYICLKLDEEFKLFLRWRGFNIDTGLFSIMFNPPQNFAAYRQSELDVARVNTFASMEAFPYISKRFALERFLGLTEEEIKKNEKMWEEENAEDMSSDPQGSDLRNIGVSTGDFEADGDTADEIDKSEQDPDDMDVAGPVSADTASAQSDMAGAGAGPLGGST